LTKKLCSDKQSSFLQTFVSYEENEVLWIMLKERHSQHCMFFLTYEWVE
jgi:hypothetical protein